MAWSRLKARWRSLLAPSVASRVDVHMAGYRAAYEGRGRAWITVDGEEVASYCEFTFGNAARVVARRLRPVGWPDWDAGFKAARAAGLRDKVDFLDAIGTCISSRPEDLLVSPEPLIRALTMLDRRVGKRRLRIAECSAEHPLVATLHRLRCEAEGIGARP